MKYLISIYLFLLIFRPYEYWPELGQFNIQRMFMIFLLIAVFFYQNKKIIINSIQVWLFSFILVLLVSSIFALDTSRAMTATTKFLDIVVFFYVLVLCIHDQESLKFVFFSFVVIMFLYVGKSMWEYFIHGRYMYRMGVARLTGIDKTYSDPNSFAATVCYSLPIVWVYLSREQLQKFWQRLIVLVYLFLCPFAIFFTGSRSGLVVGLFFFLLIFFRIKKKYLVVLFGCALLIISWQVLPEAHRMRFMSLIDPSLAPAAKSAEESAQGRVRGLKHGIYLIKKYPLFGVGPDNARLSWSDGTQIHNLYGQVMGETGFLGVLTFFGFVGSVMMVFYRNIHQLEEMKKADCACCYKESDFKFLLHLNQAALMTILLLLFNGLFGHNMFRYTWLLISFIAISSQTIIEKMGCQSIPIEGSI